MFVLLGNLAARLEETYSLESRVEVRFCVSLLSCYVLLCLCVWRVCISILSGQLVSVLRSLLSRCNKLCIARCSLHSLLFFFLAQT